ncbi:hypothetical protein [Nevskia ramosa]|uniref:hypothetical protein n=1 Tax=Nevskia ramosa TaxID=64002 RepID=UPI0012EC8349|nr:hypothetical protein [Nevskia ramosa]
MFTDFSSREWISNGRRHSRAGGTDSPGANRSASLRKQVEYRDALDNPVLMLAHRWKQVNWIPACAGMTLEWGCVHSAISE